MAKALPPELRVTLDPVSFLKILAICAAMWVLYALRDLLLLIFIACLVASALYPVITWLKVKRFPRRLSILGCYLILLILISGFLALVLSILISQGSEFILQLPALLESATTFLSHYLPVDLGGYTIADVGNYLGGALAQGAHFFVSALSYLFAIGKGLVGLVTVLVFTFFLIMDVSYFEGIVLKTFPADKREVLRPVLRTIPGRIGGYIRGQLLVMTAVGMAIWLGLTLLGTPYAFVLGGVSFCLEIIPMAGPVLAAMVGTLVTLGHDPTMAPWVLLLYFIVQQLENYLLIPFILGKAVGMHPFWTFLSILVGGSLLGVPGVILAVPVAAVVHMVWKAFESPMNGPKASLD